MSARKLLIVFVTFIGAALSGTISAVGQASQRDDAALALISTATVAMGVPSLASVWGLSASGVRTVHGDARPFIWTETATSFRYAYKGASTSEDEEELASAGHFYSFREDGAKALSPMLVRGHLCLALPTLTLLSVINDPTVSLSYKGEQTLYGRSYLAVQTVQGRTATDHLLTEKVWYFDPATKIITGVEYYVPDQPNLTGGFLIVSLFSDYRTLSGALVPFHIETGTVDKQLTTTYELGSVDLNSDVPPNTFDPR